MIYFDHNATSPLLPEAREAWLEAAEQFIGNPSSAHRLGARAENALENARLRLARLLGCDPGDFVFTSGATEANNLVFSHFSQQGNDGEVWLSSIEHPAAMEPARRYFEWKPRFIPVLSNGMVDLNWIEQEPRKRPPALIGCMAANNETGVLQPWSRIRDLASSFGAPFFCDATQWLGRLPAKDLGKCDFVSGSAHKFGGPRGVGFLKCPTQGPFHSSILGGGQQEGRRAGTENVPGILAMVAAFEARERRIASAKPPSEARGFERRLLQALPGSEIVGRSAERLWNTVSVLTPESDCRQRWVVKLDKLGFAVSTGSACASGKEHPSHVLTAMGYSAAQAGRALRFSSGWETPGSEWDLLLEALRKVHRATQRTEN